MASTLCRRMLFSCNKSIVSSGIFASILIAYAPATNEAANCQNVNTMKVWEIEREKWDGENLQTRCHLATQDREGFITTYDLLVLLQRLCISMYKLGHLPMQLMKLKGDRRTRQNSTWCTLPHVLGHVRKKERDNSHIRCPGID